MDSEIRFKEQVGIITSDATIDQFKFFVTPLINSMGVQKEDYVMVDHPFLGESCPLLAIVKELRNYEEIVGTSIRENKSVKTIATGEIIGYVDVREPKTKFLRELAVPPKPGSRVFLPYLEFLEDVFSRTYGGKQYDHLIHIGELESNANSRDGGFKHLKFFFNSIDFSTHHILLSAISGSGKTHTAAVIVEELINKTGLPAVILDPHSEYSTIGIPDKHVSELAALERLQANDYPFNYDVQVLAFDEKGLTKKLQNSEIDLKADPKLTIQPFSRQFKSDKNQSALKMRDESKELIERNRVTILDSGGITQEDSQQFFTYYMQTLWAHRLSDQGEPFLLVVEEAANLEVEMLRRIASEGRRLGITMCLLTQHPTEIDGKVLSQMGTHMIGRTTDAADLEYLKNLAGDKSSLLPHLRPGEWIINSANLNRPIKVVARERYSVKI